MVRGDGQLTHEPWADDPRPRDACGLIGIWAPGTDVSSLAYAGLVALQHRGHEGAGIAVGDGNGFVVYKDLGLVGQVFDERILDSLSPGHVAVGHCRYGTSGKPRWENVQPVMAGSEGLTFVLAHNGNIVNLAELNEEPDRDSSDSHQLAVLLARTAAGRSIFDAAQAVLPRVRGGFSLVFADEHGLCAARDVHGLRPLALGRLPEGWVIASETAAFDTLGATWERDVEPGELLRIDSGGISSTRFAAQQRAACVFEFIYLARPDSVLSGRQVYEARVDMGRRLARRHPVEADLVIGIPASGEPASIGYAEESGIPWAWGLVRNEFVGRAFIEPDDANRHTALRVKLSAIRDVVRGKRVVMVDDSIVRGTTQRRLVRILREAAALEVHVRVSSPPITWPCFYGVDIAERTELISAGLAVDDVRRSIGADSLAYSLLDDMAACTGQEMADLCTGCFTGRYPTS
ncbi:amidophosphoribosyltransferase [Actinoplanes aureus]|uniref:Amidophosphoribosyltransferase n=1 Tax=Actinoplanes aureus TaxID=2792083 RepID=A0A931G1I2_9ACTN|nr:amidophosphoribosyltransferase [Actinoplanes aureus]MBG0567045.1 amidophosphoribosyltransferase [Actinoplanes aureus]